jgi:two-component system nitrate/nitrite response regulator NarL
MGPGVSLPCTVQTACKKIIVVVPERLYRDAIEHLLRTDDRIIVGGYESLQEIDVFAADFVTPDLLVVGLDAAPASTGVFDQIGRLRAHMPAAKWILLTRQAGPELVRNAVDAGVDDLLLQNAPFEVLQSLTELVMRGHSLILASMSQMLVSDRSEPLSPAADMPAATDPADHWIDRRFSYECRSNPLPEEPQRELSQVELAARVTIPPGNGREIRLSNRENEILRLLVEGQSNKCIARRLQIAEATVKVHVKALLRKMHVKNRTQAAISALNIANASASAGSMICLPYPPNVQFMQPERILEEVELLDNVTELAAD